MFSIQKRLELVLSLSSYCKMEILRMNNRNFGGNENYLSNKNWYFKLHFSYLGCSPFSYSWIQGQVALAGNEIESANFEFDSRYFWFIFKFCAVEALFFFCSLLGKWCLSKVFEAQSIWLLMKVLSYSTSNLLSHPLSTNVSAFIIRGDGVWF